MIVKATISFDVWLQADNIAEATMELDNKTLADALYETDDGLWIRGSKRVSGVEERTAQCHADMLSIGNDGSFFDDI